MSHRYGIFSWWWAHSCPKHVEKSNKRIKKICVPSWFYLQVKKLTAKFIKYQHSTVHSNIIIYVRLYMCTVKTWEESEWKICVLWPVKGNCHDLNKYCITCLSRKYWKRKNVRITGVRNEIWSRDLPKRNAVAFGYIFLYTECRSYHFTLEATSNVKWLMGHQIFLAGDCYVIDIIR